MTDVKKSLLEEAESIINGHRRNTYGKPENNFARIATLWNTWLDMVGKSTYVSVRDVPIMMGLVKLARLAETPDHRDSIVDMIGYAACYGELMLAKENLRTFEEVCREAMATPGEIVVEPPTDVYSFHGGRQGEGAAGTAPSPIIPRRGENIWDRARIGDKVQYDWADDTGNGGTATGKVTDIDDFHAWMRLQIDGEWVANDRIVAIL